jgi:hypothetical protein
MGEDDKDESSKTRAEKVRNQNEESAAWRGCFYPSPPLRGRGQGEGENEDTVMLMNKRGRNHE